MQGEAGRPMATAWRLAAVVAVLAAVLAGCVRTPPEQALRGSFDRLIEAAEARDAGAVAALLADDFIGPGGMDRAGARRLAALHFMRHGSVGVLAGPLEIQLTGQDSRARVRFNVLLSAGEGGRVLPDTARAWQVDTGWRRTGDDWRMTSADWTPALR